jgi:hypothetical protein
MDNFEEQLEKTRTKLYEQTKDMEKNEAIAFVNENARKIAAKYGIEIAHLPQKDTQKISI